MIRTGIATCGVTVALAATLAACGAALTGATTLEPASAEQVVDAGRNDTADAPQADAGESSVAYTVSSNQSLTITEAGTYVLTGTAVDATVYVDVDGEQEVTLVLSGLDVANEDKPCVYVSSANRVHIECAEGTDNALSVSGAFGTDGDGVIYSKDDLTLEGMGSLTINSTKHAVVSKDDLKVKGGTYRIVAKGKAFDVNDTLTVKGGTTVIEASEGLEATVVRIEDGEVTITATDDGINATPKSDETDIGDPTILIMGGTLSIDMGEGDTDAIDSNGYLYIQGGIVTISAQFAFDFDLGSELSGGTVVVNGEPVTEITNSMRAGGAGLGALAP